MEQTKLDKIMLYVGYTITTISIVIIGIYLKSMSGTPSCSGDFVRGNMSATDVKESCSGLTEVDLYEAVEEYYPSGNITTEEALLKIKLLEDIEETYLE